MKHQIYCTPAECVKLRTIHTREEIAWALEVMSFYGCRPRKEDGDNLALFVADVFAAGRVSGKREERRKNRT